MDLTQEVKERVLGEGMDAVGLALADRMKDAPEGRRPTDILPSANSVIVAAIHVLDSVYDLPYTRYEYTNLFFVLKEGNPPAPYSTVILAQDAGAVTINYGIFINAIVSFLIVAFALFLVIRSMNRLQREEEAPPAEPTSKECPYCKTEIPIGATRCPHCTSEL